MRKLDCRLKLIGLDWTLLEGCRLIVLNVTELSDIEGRNETHCSVSFVLRINKVRVKN